MGAGKPYSREVAVEPRSCVWPCPAHYSTDPLQTDCPLALKAPKAIQGPPALSLLPFKLGSQASCCSPETVYTGQGLPGCPWWHVWPPDVILLRSLW